MLNIHTPLSWFRAAVRRRFHSESQKSSTPRNRSDKESPKDEDPPENGNESPVRRSSRIVIFFVGVLWAIAIGLFVSLLLAVVPSFEPDIGAFPDRLFNIIQAYGIPLTSAILIWFGYRATF
jgi:hypothetical protein